MAWRLAIDFGTSVTTAAFVVDDGPVEMLNLDGGHMPSAVFAERDGSLLVGTAALGSADLALDCFLETPKRRVGDSSIQLGGHTFTPRQVMTAVLGKVLFEAFYQRGRQAPDLVVLTHPARWRKKNIGLLRDAFEDGLDSLPALFKAAGHPEMEDVGMDTPPPCFLAEPIAAGYYFLGDARAQSTCAVYDLGGGTFDTSLVRRDQKGRFEVLGSGGIENLGGVDFDAALVDYVGEVGIIPKDPGAWEKLRHPEPDDRDWNRRARRLREQAKTTKEELTTHSQKYCPLPELDLDGVLVNQTDFWDLIEPHVTRTVEELRATIERSGLAPGELREVHLVGGSSRIPLVATMLNNDDDLAVRVTIEGSPSEVVVRGALVEPEETLALRRAENQWGGRAAHHFAEATYEWDDERHMVAQPLSLAITADHLLVMRSDGPKQIPLTSLTGSSVRDLPAGELVNFDNGRSHFGGGVLTIGTDATPIIVWFPKSRTGGGFGAEFLEHLEESKRNLRSEGSYRLAPKRLRDIIAADELNPKTNQPQTEGETTDIPEKKDVPAQPPIPAMTLVLIAGSPWVSAENAVKRATNVRLKLGSRGWVLPRSTCEEWLKLFSRRLYPSVFTFNLPATQEERKWLYFYPTSSKPLGLDWMAKHYSGVNGGKDAIEGTYVLVECGKLGSLLPQVVKKNASSWFELAPGAYIADGLSGVQWTDLFVGSPGLASSVCGFYLPSRGNRSWTSSGRNSTRGMAWLKAHYTTR